MLKNWKILLLLRSTSVFIISFAFMIMTNTDNGIFKSIFITIFTLAMMYSTEQFKIVLEFKSYIITAIHYSFSLVLALIATYIAYLIGFDNFKFIGITVFFFTSFWVYFVVLPNCTNEEYL